VCVYIYILACCLYCLPDAVELKSDTPSLSDSEITGQIQLFIAFELEVCTSILFVLQPFTAKQGVVTIISPILKKSMQ